MHTLAHTEARNERPSEKKAKSSPCLLQGKFMLDTSCLEAQLQQWSVHTRSWQKSVRSELAGGCSNFSPVLI